MWISSEDRCFSCFPWFRSFFYDFPCFPCFWRFHDVLQKLYIFMFEEKNRCCRLCDNLSGEHNGLDEPTEHFFRLHFFCVFKCF